MSPVVSIRWLIGQRVAYPDFQVIAWPEITGLKSLKKKTPVKVPLNCLKHELLNP